jgi:hypothetical protein
MGELKQLVKTQAEVMKEKKNAERAFAPCVVLVINDNLYGLMFASSFICRSCP